MGQSTELVQSGKHLEKNKLCRYIHCIIPKVHISSNCAVNSHFAFLDSVGIFFLSQIALRDFFFTGKSMTFIVLTKQI